MSEQTQNDTPIFDELMAQRMPRAAERVVDLPPPAASMGSQALQEVQSAPTPRHAEGKPEKEKVFLSTEGYSQAAKSAVIDPINDAILDGERSIRGKSFIDYANEHQGYVAAHEFTRLQREVRAL